LALYNHLFNAKTANARTANALITADTSISFDEQAALLADIGFCRYITLQPIAAICITNAHLI
jgi:hypothetical protein